MTKKNAVSRRESLKRIAIGTAVGTTVLGATSVMASDDRDAGVREPDESDDGPGRAEGGGIELVPECAEPSLDLAAFRVDNHTKQDVTLEWRIEERKRRDDRKGRVAEDRRDDGARRGAEERRDDEVIQFLDCHTVRIVGDFPEVILYALELFETFDGEIVIGAMGSFPWGPVEGERTIDFQEELNQPLVVSAVDVLDRPFGESGNILYERLNPDLDRCIEELFADAGLEPPADDGPDGADAGESLDDPLPNRGTLTAAANDSSDLVLPSPGGDATVRLFRDGDEIARSSSADTPRREETHANVDVDENALESRGDVKNDP
jgi:hypothetical protein